MTRDTKQPKAKLIKFLGIGAALGAAVGVALGSSAVGVGLGVVLGAVLFKTAPKRRT
jgi:hypothetical protein